MEAKLVLFGALGLAAALVSAAFLASCGGGSLESLERESGDPSVAAPRVLSFSVEGRVCVSWDEDSRADEYILETASGSCPSPAFSVAYRGKATSFVDGSLEDQSLRLYRLVKTRGDRAFGPSEAILGVCSATCGDSWEPNDSAEAAVDLGYAKSANLFCYRSYDGQRLRDVDWYSVRVPPRMKAYVVVEQLRPRLAFRETSGLVFAMKGRSPEAVSNGALIELPNYSYSEATIAFEISPQDAYFIGSGGPQGGSLVDYALRVERLDSSI